MPFVPIVLLLAWHALSRSASFALGWATALFFGQIPGNKGRVLAMISLLAVAWLILLIGAALPLAGVQLGISLGLLDPAVREEPASLWLIGLVYGLVVVLPPIMLALAEQAEFGGQKSFGRWVARVPISYPIAVSIGVSILLMVVIAPVVIAARMREGRKILQLPLVVPREEGLEDLLARLERVLAETGHRPRREVATGPISWPLRTLGFAARQLLGSVITGQPTRLVAGDVEVIVYSTDISITGRGEAAYRLRAAIERELAFTDAFLTWSEDSQRFEAELTRLSRDRNGDLASLLEQLQRIQDRLDRPSLKSDEWNVLYRLRLQVEREARIQAAGGA